MSLPILLFNTTIVKDPGVYVLSQPMTAEVARELIAGRETFSAVGHESMARIMSAILRISVPMNRIPTIHAIGQTALCLKMRGRLPEGFPIHDETKIHEIGFDFFGLTRIG